MSGDTTFAYWTASLCLWALISFHVIKHRLPLWYAAAVSVGSACVLFLLARAAS